MKLWFPINKEQIEDIEFQKLTPLEKCYYWLLSSEYNYWFQGTGSLVREDSWFAATLSVSVISIRNARRKFQGMGWIKTKHGFQVGFEKGDSQNFATEYFEVKWSYPTKAGKRQFARMDKHTFEMLLDQISFLRLTLSEIVIYIYLHYWSQLEIYWNNSETGKFSISKSKLRKETGIFNSPERVRNLFNGTSYGGVNLFEYEEKYQALEFTKWRTFIDPDDNEVMLKSANARKERIKFAQLVLSKGQKAIFTDTFEEAIRLNARMLGFELQEVPETLKVIIQMSEDAEDVEDVEDFK